MKNIFTSSSNALAARDRKLAMEMSQKATARRYQQWAISAGLSPQDAYRYASSDVQKGMLLIRAEERHHSQQLIRREKERIAARFSVGQGPRT